MWKESILNNVKVEAAVDEEDCHDGFKLNIHIPITPIIKKQAASSYFMGIIEALTFVNNLAIKDITLTPEILIDQYRVWGMPEELIDILIGNGSNDNEVVNDKK